MQQRASTPTTISIDLKKYRIRIRKSTLRLLGDPQFIQLLVDPQNMLVAIRSVENDSSFEQTHRINQKQVLTEKSAVLYSRSFITRLCTVTGNLDCGAIYRISGEVIPSQKLAAFSLKTLQRISS